MNKNVLRSTFSLKSEKIIILNNYSKKDEYNEIICDIIIIDKYSYILESGKEENCKIEIIEQNQNFEFISKYLVIFKSLYNVESFELFLFHEGLREVMIKKIIKINLLV